MTHAAVMPGNRAQTKETTVLGENISTVVGIHDG
jgi:hypothetical protein